MRVLIVGGGGREHAMAWKAAQAQSVERVLVAPGNAGTASEDKVENASVAADDLPALLTLAKTRSVDLTIVGPEAPLVAGIVDAFSEAGLRCFGPGREAARLEGSKSFSKNFLIRHRIPTGEFAVFTEVEAAQDYVRRRGVPIVIKADGLAAGKGVVVAHSLEEADQALDGMLSAGALGDAGRQVVVEEFLSGEEASFIVMVDGKHILPLASSQDHKARDDGDQGPNTGGMGAYSPAPVVDNAMHQRIMREIIEPTVHGMALDGHPYRGFLYAGVMISPDGVPKVLEFNCRCGDPETQPIMLRLNTNLVTLCEAAVEGRLDEVICDWDPRPSLGVVLAAGGYPGSYRRGDPIAGLDALTGIPDLKVFHAGTRNQGDQVLCDGGRVLCVTALGDNVAQAQSRAYAAVERIHWPNMYYRTDIGYRALAR